MTMTLAGESVVDVKDEEIAVPSLSQRASRTRGKSYERSSIGSLVWRHANGADTRGRYFTTIERLRWTHRGRKADVSEVIARTSSAIDPAGSFEKAVSKR